MNERLFVCPRCESEIERVIGSANIRFKGENFYSNKEG